MLNLFYEEPDPDRWLPLDRYPRRIARRLVRGKPMIGGQERVYLNLRAGLDRIGVRYRVNDYRHAMRHPDELVCVVGKGHVLTKTKWRNPILAGSAIGANPIDDRDLLDQFPIRRILVPGPWSKAMCKPAWGDRVEAWAVGIDTDRWCPSATEKPTDILLYDKVRWEHDAYNRNLLTPIRVLLREAGRSLIELRYGSYRDDDFQHALGECRAMIFVCEHETQGIAYQQALSCGVPILAWDRGGVLQDPAFYPHKARFGPVTSVPYWDGRCGERFADIADFAAKWDAFWNNVVTEKYRPRQYILENLTLERCANAYMRYVRACEAGR